MTARFMLFCDEVPEPPESALWVDLLRWIVCIMDPDDPRLTLVARCLSDVSRRGTLTDNQATECQRVLSAICEAWENGKLACQNNIPPDDVKLMQPTARKH